MVHYDFISAQNKYYSGKARELKPDLKNKVRIQI